MGIMKSPLIYIESKASLGDSYFVILQGGDADSYCLHHRYYNQYYRLRGSLLYYEFFTILDIDSLIGIVAKLTTL